MKKIILFILIILILTTIGFGFVYAEKASIINIFLTPEEKELKEIQRLREMFPEKLGTYELYGLTPEKIQVKLECDDVEKHPDTRDTELAGKICVKTIITEYREIVSNKIIFVHFSQIYEGREISQQLFERFTKKEKLGNFDVVRIENHEIGWSPASAFDFILTQEGIVKPGKSGGESMNYGTATGNNPVTQYFIEKYPPSESGLVSDEVQDKIEINISPCTDTDGGENYYIKGTVSCASQSYTDFCKANDIPNMLVEYVTNGNGVGTPNYVCPNGCRDGACIR